MRYVTTRNQRQVYTAKQALGEDRGADGGFFVPCPMPAYSQADLEELWALPFTARIARVLNDLFDTTLTQWDVDFCVGRRPVRLVRLPQRILQAQCWHNWEGDLSFLVRVLASRLRGDGETIAQEWIDVAVRIALLLAILGEVRQAAEIPPGQKMDVSLLSGQFLGPISAWYARAWGAPIGNIVCCCNENNLIWELLCRGQLRTDAIAVPTGTPLGDVAVPMGLEWLISAAGGPQEVSSYLEAVWQGGIYTPDETVLESMTQGMAVSVVGRQRMEATLRSVYACGTLLSPYDGLCHAGLLDHRTKTGSRAWALIFSERAPRLDSQAVAAAFEGCASLPQVLEALQ